MTDFTPEQKAWMEKNARCPFCGCSEVSEGPAGGLSVNLYCCGEFNNGGVICRCTARFNSTPFGMELIQDSVPEDRWVYKNTKPEHKLKIPARPKSKYTADEIVAKFTGHKKHWWQRKVRP